MADTIHSLLFFVLIKGNAVLVPMADTIHSERDGKGYEL